MHLYLFSVSYLQCFVSSDLFIAGNCLFFIFYILLLNSAYNELENLYLFFQEEILPMVLAQNLTLSFSSESSIQDELNRESTADAITIVVTILYMQKPFNIV